MDSNQFNITIEILQSMNNFRDVTLLILTLSVKREHPISTIPLMQIFERKFEWIIELT